MSALGARLAELAGERNELLKQVAELQARCATAAARLESAQGGGRATSQARAATSAPPAVGGDEADLGGAANDTALKMLNEVSHWPRPLLMQ